MNSYGYMKVSFIFCVIFLSNIFIFVFSPNRPGRIKHVPSESFSHTVVASSAPAIKITAPTNPLQNKKKGKKDKKGILQKMLMQEKRDRVNPERSSTLAAFLSSL